jgi:HD-GYP domain-containing protein (c-di-GMP phosphodiesterase class II)
MQPLPLRARVFVAIVAVAAVPLPVFAFVQGRGQFALSAFIGLGILIVLTDSIGARGSRDLMTIALSSVVSSASLPLVGGWGAIVLASATALAWDHQPPIKRLFNTSQMILAATASAAMFTLLGGEPIHAGSFPGLLLPFSAALVAHCVVNGSLVAVIVSLHQGVPLRVVFQGTMVQSLPNYFGYGLFGLLLAVLWAKEGAGVGPTAALLLLLPLVVARWAYAQFAEEQRAYDRTVRTLMAAVETKDVYTRGHSERVSTASVLVARAIGMREDRVASLRYAGMLHDVGKLGVPTRVLQKSGGLTEDEFAAIQRHPMQGLEIVREIEFLDEANAGIMHHHERIDGLGYPMGLAGDRIPEFARVIAVADAFDSMTTTRSYRGARTLEAAVAELRRCAGTQFDPAMVEALVRGLDEHGWEPEAVPVFSAPEPDEVFDQEQRAYDHDDPTSSLVEEQS